MRWGFILSILGLALYYPSFSFDFVNYDDPFVLVEKSYVRNFELDSILTTPIAGLYHPVTSLSHAIDWKLGDGNPHVFHVTNFLIHLLSSLLLFLIVQRLYPKSPWTAQLMSLIFLIHPLKVESVGWITERKDLLSVFFIFLCWYFYLRFQEGQRKFQWYSVLAFIFATLSKISIIPAPAVLLLMDWKKHGKIRRQDLLEKLYFILPALPIFWVNVEAQKKYGMDMELDAEKFLHLPLQLLFYLEKMFFPIDLRPIYLLPSLQVGILSVLAVFLILIIYWLLYKTAHDKKAEIKNILFGLFFFIIFLGPNLKLIRYGDENIVNDRYVYLASVGFFLSFIPSLISRLQNLNRRSPPFIAVGSAMIAVLIFWMSLLPKQLSLWRDTLSLWQVVLDHEPSSVKAAGNLAKHYVLQEKYQKAIDILLDIKGTPEDAAVLGYAYEQLGYSDKSRYILEKSLELYPKNPDIINILALRIMKDGKIPEALEMLDVAEQNLKEESSETLRSQIYMHQGLGLMASGRLTEAENKFRSGIALSENDEKILYNLGLCLIKLNRPDEAETVLLKSIKINPKRAEAFHNLGIIAFGRKDLKTAIERFNLALSIRPDFQEARQNLNLIEQLQSPAK